MVASTIEALVIEKHEAPLIMYSPGLGGEPISLTQVVVDNQKAVSED